MPNGLTLKYRRILLKVSGEFFSSEHESIDPERVAMLAKNIAELVSLGVQVSIVLGAGNLCRGQTFAQAGFDQVAADHIGMMATIMNALALKDVLRQQNITSVVRSAFDIAGITPVFCRDEALEQLNTGKVLICAGGTGNPLVTTDSAAALRAIELKVDVLLKATKVEGVYSADPFKDKNAQLFSEITYQEVIEQQLKIMDTGAFCLVRDHKVPVRIFNMNLPGIFKKIVLGETVGTLVHSGD